MLYSSIANENILEEIRIQSKKHPREAKKLKELMKKKRQIIKQHASFLRIDLGLELYYQISLQLIMVLLSYSATATTEGFTQIFRHNFK